MSLKVVYQKILGSTRENTSQGYEGFKEEFGVWLIALF